MLLYFKILTNARLQTLGVRRRSHHRRDFVLNVIVLARFWPSPERADEARPGRTGSQTGVDLVVDDFWCLVTGDQPIILHLLYYPIFSQIM